MRLEALTAEAEHCRQIAAEFSGRPEQPFLIQLASALEELALVQKELDFIGRSGSSAEGVTARA